MQEPNGRKWYIYSPEFKQSAVDRLVAGESASVIARELKVRRKFLYAWRDDGYGSKAIESRTREVAAEDPQQERIAKLEQQIADLQRLVGQQAAELDFFALALRATTESRPKKKVNSVVESTPQSRM